MYEKNPFPHLSQDEFESELESLLLDRNGFANISGMGAPTWGVDTGCVRCNDCETDENLFNACARENLFSELFLANKRAVEDIGYDLTPTYHVETHKWDGKSRIQLNRPGVKKVNVVRSITDSGLDPVTVNYLIDDSPGVNNHENKFCYVRVLKSTFPNPNSVLVRFQSNLGLVRQITIPGWPKSNGDFWEIPLDNDVVPPCSDFLDVYSCEFAYFDIPDISLEEGQELHPVYPNSNQKIPALRKVPNGDGSTRWYVHLRDLVHPDFTYEAVDLTGAAEYYKMLQEVSFKIFGEANQTASVTYREENNCAPPTFTNADALRIDIIDAFHSIVQPYISDPCSCSLKEPYEITIYYQTDPDVLGVSPRLGLIAGAIAYLAAAEMNLVMCGCSFGGYLGDDVPTPTFVTFIALAQREYTEVRIGLSGGIVENREHNNTFGHRTYLERVAAAPKVRKSKSF